jgi:hypothetical protein
MIWGDQWLCPCGWYNLFVRKRCRNCGEPALPNEKIVTVFEALSDARGNVGSGKPPHGDGGS